MQQRDTQIGEDKDRVTTEQESLLLSSSNEESTLDEAKLEQTDEVVVSATKTRQPVSHVTSAVEVIPANKCRSAISRPWRKLFALQPAWRYSPVAPKGP